MIETSNNNLSDLAQEALTARLYVPGWTMSKVLKRATSDDSSLWYEKVAIYRDDGKPVGAAIVDDGGTVNIFVRKSYRRKGIGTKLLEAVNSGNLKGCYGVVGSMEFFRANDVYAER